MTDGDCVESIRELSVIIGSEKADFLVQSCQNEHGGAIKADLCRGAALLQTGGLYFDVDLGVRMSVWDILQHNTTFSSVTSNTKPNEPKTFFQAFMAATPRHPFVRRYIELFYDHYAGKLPNPLEPDADVGVFLLQQAWEDLKEQKNTTNDFTQTAELFYEFLFRPQLQRYLPHIRPPTWGKHKYCRYMVAFDKKDPNGGGWVLPFYSRVANSHGCLVFPGQINF